LKGRHGGVLAGRAVRLVRHRTPRKDLREDRRRGRTGRLLSGSVDQSRALSSDAERRPIVIVPIVRR
jgi:hypothetical protein